VNSADRHLDYHWGRQADLVRDARRRALAGRFMARRADERHSFLRRAWERWFGQPVIQAAADVIPEAPPAPEMP